LIGTAACVVLSRSIPSAITVWHQFETHYPGGRAPLVCVLAGVLAPVLMFRLLTDWVPFPLTGRKWLADGSVLCYVVFLVSLISAGVWVGQHLEYLPRVLAAIPWIVAFVAILKACIVATAFRVALRRRLVDWRQIGLIFTIWAVIAAAMVALALLVTAPVRMSSTTSLLAGAASFAPLARFPLATLAVEWNRHR
jgi:hypothetical protein